MSAARAGLAARGRADQGLASPASGDFLPWALQRAGLDSARYRGSPLERRLPACLRALKVDTVEEARSAISRDPALLEIVVGALLNGTTEFFRDRPVFDFLAGTVLPALALRDGPIRVWSAACSSGAELYSIAIQLDRLGLLARGVLLGTDCRRGAIAEATAATYGNAALANVTAPLRRQYFEPVDGQWRAVVRLRHAVQWRVEDLATCPAEATWDLILWRNAGMYLLPGPAAVTGAQLLASLRPGGYLVLGKAERPPAGLGAKQVAHCVYQRGGQ